MTSQLVGVLQCAMDGTCNGSRYRGTYGRGQNLLDECRAPVCQNGVTRCIPTALIGCTMSVARCVQHVCSDGLLLGSLHFFAGRADKRTAATSGSGFPAQAERVSRFAYCHAGQPTVQWQVSLLALLQRKIALMSGNLSIVIHLSGTPAGSFCVCSLEVTWSHCTVPPAVYLSARVWELAGIHNHCLKHRWLQTLSFTACAARSRISIGC